MTILNLYPHFQCQLAPASGSGLLSTHLTMWPGTAVITQESINLQENPQPMADEQITYEVKAGEFVFLFTEEEVNHANVVNISPGHYHILRNHRSAHVRVSTAGASGKQLIADTEGETFRIVIKDELDKQLDKMGYGASTNKQVKEIRAPMPGLVLEVTVSEGQEVTEGDRLLILEAMKMENSIMIQAKARIKRVAVKAGQAVEKGQLLVELD